MLEPGASSVVSKQNYEVDLTEEAPSSLQSHLILSQVNVDSCFHTASNLRLPLGIYNVSTSRLCNKLLRLCSRLEEYFFASSRIDLLKKEDELMEEVIDYIELSLYAAAEHVDDIYAIASGFFKSKQLRDKSPYYRQLDKSLKDHKRLLSAAANHLKHQQARIRMFSLEYSQAGREGCLHGYFIEGVESGVVCPSRTFHSQHDTFSITTLVWEAILLLLNCSKDLAQFLKKTAPLSEGEVGVKLECFANTVRAAARLPIYTFGESHPFSRATIRLKTDEKSNHGLNSGLYGSVLHGWLTTEEVVFGRTTSRFEGDGVSRSFRFAQPKSVSLHHWS